MRITESLIANNLTANIDNSSTDYQKYQEQLATGRQLNQPSDNPSGTAQSLAIRAALTNMKQYLTNAGTAKNYLSMADTQLNSATNLVQQARQIAVAAANGGTQTPDTMHAYSDQIDAIISQLTNVANSDVGGQYIFSGQQVNTPPYNQSDPTHTYHGDLGALTASLGSSETLQINKPGSAIFSSAFSALESLKAHIGASDSASISNSDLGAIDTALSAVDNTRAQFGNKLNEVTDSTTRLQSIQQQYTDQLSTIEDVDIASAYAQLQVAQNVYQASLVTTSKALSMSLADYLH